MQEFIEGKKAFSKDLKLEDNPYPVNSKEAINWTNGWFQADFLENREYIGLGSSNTLHINL